MPKTPKGICVHVGVRSNLPSECGGGEHVGGFLALTLNTDDEQAFLKALVGLFNVYRADAETLNAPNSPFAP